MFHLQNGLGYTSNSIQVQWVMVAAFSDEKLPDLEPDYSPPTIADVNAWSHASILRYIFMAWCLVTYRDNVAVFLSFAVRTLGIWSSGLQYCVVSLVVTIVSEKREASNFMAGV
jgi:hypothetical protein